MEEKVTKYSTGVCQFCGQSIALAAEHDTQDEADTVATLACKCEEGKPFRRMVEEKATIREIFGRDDPNAQALICTLTDAVREGYIEGATLKLREGYIEGATLKLRDGVTAKLKPKDGMVVVSRTVKHEHQKTL